MSDLGFTVEVDQNQCFPEGGRDVSAMVTVTSSGTAGAETQAADAAAGSAEVIIMDCSGSMSLRAPRSGRAARRPRRPWGCSATACCSRLSPARTSPGRSTPPDGSMAVADARTRGEARLWRWPGCRPGAERR